MANVDKGPELAARADSGLSCLVMLARFHNGAASAGQLQHEFATDGEPFGRAEILLAAKALGLIVKSVRSNPSRLSQLLTHDSNARQAPTLRTK